MMRLINLNRISRTKREENEDGYGKLEAAFPYSFEDMIFEHNLYINIHSYSYFTRYGIFVYVIVFLLNVHLVYTINGIVRK